MGAHITQKGQYLCQAKWDEALEDGTSEGEWDDTQFHDYVVAAEERAWDEAIEYASGSNSRMADLLNAVKERDDDDELQHLLQLALG